MDSSTTALILTTLFALGGAGFLYLKNQINELKAENKELREKADLLEGLLFKAVIGLKSGKSEERIKIANEILQYLQPKDLKKP